MATSITSLTGLCWQREAVMRSLVELSEGDFVISSPAASSDESLSSALPQLQSAQRSYEVDRLEGLCAALYVRPDLRAIWEISQKAGAFTISTIGQAAWEAGMPELPIAKVEGNNLLDSIEELLGWGAPLAHTHSGEPFADLHGQLLTATAEIGADAQVEAFSSHARIVVAEDVSRGSMAVAAARAQGDKDAANFDAISGIAVGGIMLEGLALLQSPQQAEETGPAQVSISEHGHVELGNPSGANTWLQARSAISVLLASEGQRYCHTPDVEIDLTDLQIAEPQPDRPTALVFGARGRPPSEALRVRIRYLAGWLGSALFSTSSLPVTRNTHELLREELMAAVRIGELNPARLNVAALNQPPAENGHLDESASQQIFRVDVCDRDHATIGKIMERLEQWARYRSCPVSLLASQQSAWIRDWPTVVPREFVPLVATIRTAKEWAQAAKRGDDHA